MLVPLRIPVSFTTTPQGTGSVATIPAQAYSCALTFVGVVVGGAQPLWVISGGGLPLAAGTGNNFTAGPIITFPGEQITITVTGAAPAVSVGGTFSGVYSTVGPAELPTQPLTVNGNTNALAGGIKRLGFSVQCFDNNVDASGELVTAVAGAQVTIYALVWHFVPFLSGSLGGASVPPVALYEVAIQQDQSSGGQAIDYIAYNVATAIGGLKSPTHDLELWERPEIVGNVGSGLTAVMRLPTNATVPTASVLVTGHLIYTQQ